MGFYECEWEDRFKVKHKVIIPYSEIIAFNIQYYHSMGYSIYTPVVRKDFEYISKHGKEGEADYLNWIDYMNNK